MKKNFSSEHSVVARRLAAAARPGPGLHKDRFGARCGGAAPPAPSPPSLPTDWMAWLPRSSLQMPETRAIRRLQGVWTSISWGHRTVAWAWRGHGPGVARTRGHFLAWVARAWRGRGAGMSGPNPPVHPESNVRPAPTPCALRLLTQSHSVPERHPLPPLGILRRCPPMHRAPN
eukprot:gene8246-biopygen7607